eukprot:Em0001g1288a
MAAWSTEEVHTLVGVWGAADVQRQLDGVTRNKKIYQEIATSHNVYGYDRTWEQCRVKVKNLVQKYKQVKDRNGVTGETRRTCPFYNELDAILGNRAATRPSVVVDSGNGSETIPVLEDEASQCSTSLGSLPSTPTDQAAPSCDNPQSEDHNSLSDTSASKKYLGEWKEFLLSTGCGTTSSLFIQFVGHSMFKTLIKAHYCHNKPAVRDDRSQDLSHIEFNAIRYTAGYVPRALKKKLIKSGHKNKKGA